MMTQKPNMIETSIITIKNTGQQFQLILLLQFRNLIMQELPSLCRTGVTKNLFDRIHQSMVIKDENDTVLGGICFYQIVQHHCVSIIYFVVDSNYQARGYGTELLNTFKQSMRQRGHKLLATQADLTSLNFYYKNGFFEYERKNKKIETQPLVLKQNIEEENVLENYKKYEPWLQYIEQYYSSILLVYKIEPKVDYKNFKKIISLQKQGVLAQLDGKEYRGHKFSRQQMEKLLYDYRKKYEQTHGILQNSKRSFQIQKQLRQQEQTTASSHKLKSKLEQITLLNIIKSHPSSWVLKMNFVKVKDPFQDLLSDFITLQVIQQNILHDHYSCIQELCAELTKLFQNLKLFLPGTTGYYQNCNELDMFITPVMRQLCQGTFNVVEYMNKKGQKQTK